MSSSQLPVWPACRQDALYPVKLPAQSLSLELCLECDLVRDETGREDALHFLMDAHDISNYATPIICRLTGLDIKEPEWEKSVLNHVLERAK